MRRDRKERRRSRFMLEIRESGLSSCCFPRDLCWEKIFIKNCFVPSPRGTFLVNETSPLE